VNLRALPGPSFFNVVYAWAAQRVEDVDKFLADLDAPLPGSVANVVGQRTIDEENAALMRFASEAKAR
jgi:hypothetical protein